jgi:hypothetical protein
MTNKSILIQFRDFMDSSDTLRVYKDAECIFKSEKDVLAPLVEFISKRACDDHSLVILDKVSGNAAALLSIKAGACQVFSPLGSQLGADTLTRHRVEHYIERMVPYILARNGKDMCPMEKLSLDKTPDEFYETIKQRFLTT